MDTSKFFCQAEQTTLHNISCHLDAKPNFFDGYDSHNGILVIVGDLLEAFHTVLRGRISSLYIQFLGPAKSRARGLEA